MRIWLRGLHIICMKFDIRLVCILLLALIALYVSGHFEE